MQRKSGPKVKIDMCVCVCFYLIAKINMFDKESFINFFEAFRNQNKSFG